MMDEMLQMYQHYYAPFAFAGLFLFSLQFLIADVVRIIQYVAFQLGYKRGSGKGVIPGPLEDTRSTRYTYLKHVGVEYRNKYGPIYRTFCGGIPEIVLSDPEDIKVYYQGDSKLHDRIENLGFGDYMEKIMAQAVGGKVGNDWRRMRACVDPHFSLDATHKILPGTISFIDGWARRLSNLPSIQNDEKNNRLIVNAEKFAFEIPFHLISRRLFGDLIDDDDEFSAELSALGDLHGRIFSRVFLSKFHHFRIYKYLPIQANRDIETFHKKWNELLLRKCLESEQRGINSPAYEIYKSMKQGLMSWDEFSHTIDEIQFANTEVMPAAISWAACELGMRPEIQNRLAKEIHTSFNDPSLGTTPEERRESYIRKTDTLLHFCYLESARLRPLFCYSFSGTTYDAKVMNGYYIPPKTSIVLDGYTLNRTAPIWGDDPNVFRPDRFATLSLTDYRYSLWRFGIGPRKCLAVNFAEKIVKTALAAIFEKYHVELKDNELGHNPKMFVYSPRGVLIFTPREGKM